MNTFDLTIFTAPKPFIDPHISNIQYNAIRSWKFLEPNVSVVLVGSEKGVEEIAKELNVAFEPSVKRNNHGTPLISSIFDIGRNINSSSLLAYINADIIIFSNFLETSNYVAKKYKKFLIVGQRWDLDINSKLNFQIGWEEHLKQELKVRGKLHPRGGSDYFIYPRVCFEQLPDFAVGRAGWDNWMFYQARKQHWACIDATKSIQIIHQNHDYSHLPGGQAHYRLPETNENVKIAGGRRTIFTLIDANYEIDHGAIKKKPLNWEKLIREIEIFPLVTLKSKILANVFFAIFHPKRAYVEFRNWLRNKKKEEKNNA